MNLWLEFVLCTGVIFLSGSRLSRIADVIAEKTGLGRTWIGVVLLASITSLPELITGVSSVAVYHLPNIAAGDIFGSCMFNLFLLGALDVSRRQAPLSSLANQGQVITAAFGILLLGGTTINLLTISRIPAIGWVGIGSFLVLLVYLLAMRVVFRYEKRRLAEYLTEVREERRYDTLSSARTYGSLLVHAALIIIAAAYLPHVADGIAKATGLTGTFVGTIFVAIATSLPEIVVSGMAVRMGAVDLAVGNILGSNLSNMAILALDDFFYRSGPLLRDVAASQAITAVGAMVMTAIVMIALVYRSKKRILFFSWESLGIYAVYALTSLLLFFS
jgi:cation:H+ antiporter